MQVFLNVYDLHHSNDYSYYIGIGIFHSGVEINGREYSYGGHEYSYSGVFDIVPRTASGAKFRESISLGHTRLSKTELERIIDDLSDQFTGNSYHPLTRNCNTFSNELCLRVLNRGIPGYVNRLANLGSVMSCLIPHYGLQYLGIAPPTTGTTDDDKNDDDDSDSGPKTYSFKAFSGIGNVLVGEDTIVVGSVDPHAGLSDEARRERAANAAYKRLGLETKDN